MQPTSQAAFHCGSTALCLTLPPWSAPPMLVIIFVAFAFCFVLERLIPGWKLPYVSTWPLRVLTINLAQLLVVVVAGISWEKWFSAYSLLQVSRYVGPVTGGLLAYVVATFVFYWWHRWRHTQDFLWLHFHQIHHSPRRIEVITSFYKHPLEMTVNSLIGGLLVYTVLGLSPAAGAVYTLCTALGEFFYHTNVRTPRWVGYVFQRPEMHRVHHQYQQHSHNYGDLVIWDWLFGTYRNPAEFQATCGFDADKEEQLGAMLRFQDVHEAVKQS
ncbi:sterol desaturase family protein [Hymenobacter sublimis]|nr:sterol desaturase family protein [Hymenobacter sublimis]